jgi:ankyrin repeat protein
MADKLHDAARANDAKRVAKLLSGSWFRKPLAVDSVNRHGLTALQVASANGHTEIVSTLLARGASLKLTDPAGRTALHWAAIFGKVQAAQVLLSQGSEPNARDERGCTPLHCAAGSYDPLELEPYISGPIVLGPAAAVQSPEERAQALKIGDAFMKVKFWRDAHDVAELLLSNGALPDLRDRDGRSPRDLAVLPKLKELLASASSQTERDDSRSST